MRGKTRDSAIVRDILEQSAQGRNERDKRDERNRRDESDKSDEDAIEDKGK